MRQWVWRQPWGMPQTQSKFGIFALVLFLEKKVWISVFCKSVLRHASNRRFSRISRKKLCRCYCSKQMWYLCACSSSRDKNLVAYFVISVLNTTRWKYQVPTKKAQKPSFTNITKCFQTFYYITLNQKLFSTFYFCLPHALVSHCLT